MIYRLDLDTNEIDMLKEILEDIKKVDIEKYKNYFSQLESFKSLNDLIANGSNI